MYRAMQRTCESCPAPRL